MTKQEFAIKLLFWLMPWPLSKAFPGLLIHILKTPAAQTPDQWAQAVYDTLTKYLRQATAYAQTLFTIIAGIPPIDELILAADALNAAIEKAISALAAFKAMLDNLADYTLDQIWQAYLDTLAAMVDLTSAIDALLQEMQKIPGLEIPDIPAPEYIPPEEIPPVPPEEILPVPPPLPPPYIPPFPPIYPPGPGPGPTVPSPHKHDRIGWYDYTSDSCWDDVECAQLEYVDDHWEVQELDLDAWLYRLGTWQVGFRPTKIRITFDCSFNEIYLRDANGTTIAEIPEDPGEHEVDIEWEDADLMSFYINPKTFGDITGIEFYGLHVSCS